MKTSEAIAVRPGARQQSSLATVIRLAESAIRDAHLNGVLSIILAIPFELGSDEARFLLQSSSVSGLVLPITSAAIRNADPRAVGSFGKDGLWWLPEGPNVVYFLGPYHRLTSEMVKEALRRGTRAIALRAGRRWIRFPIAALRGGAVMEGVAPCDVRLFRSILSGSRSSKDAQPGRIILVCGNLSPGGAERQVVYTMTGLERRGFHDIQLLCDTLEPARPEKFDFYLPMLRDAGIRAETIGKATLDDLEPDDATWTLREFAHRLPAELLADIVALYREFRLRQPEVVHAWLDWSNTRAGIAAALAGVPRILISGRNLNPTHFNLYQPYMDPAYSALCERSNVVFVNNSRAGADDYAKWLDLEPGGIRVIHNAVDFGDRRRSSPAEITALRQDLRIPPAAPVVGSAFRFEEEKRPLFWLEVAAIIARQFPETRFVLFGQGSMRSRMAAAANRLGLRDRLLMPGVRDDVLAAISMFDVFILTSAGEGLPNVLLEAQWVGTPVVTTDVGGAREAIFEGGTGFLGPSEDANEIAALACRILADSIFRARAANIGPAYVRSRFNIDRMLDETLSGYGFAGRGPTPVPSDIQISDRAQTRFLENTVSKITTPRP
jgi:glycosyltransferase involved in cell wall biosynthesis